MKQNKNIFLLSIAITIGLFTYLTIHHYSLKLGLSGNSLCSINPSFNCDAAALSSYSEIFNIPIAIFGAIFHLILLGLVLFYRFGWLETNSYLERTVRMMTSASAVVSIIMGLISVTIIKVACPFCVGTYIFSFLNLYLGWNYIEHSDKATVNYFNYFSEYKSYLFTLLCIPLLSWVIAGMIEEKFGLNEIKKIIPEKIAQWKASPMNNFNLEIGLSLNKSPDAKAVIVEFADFKCPHCKVASQTLDRFTTNNPQVHFIYKPFPLDGTCNTSSQMPKGDGSRCTLAAWTLCSEKLFKKGWALHHWLFEHQEDLLSLSNVQPLLPQIEKDLQIDTKAISVCADTNEIFEEIKKSADEGNLAQVSGTPTIYLNGKKLPYGQIIDVLQAAVNEVK